MVTPYTHCFIQHLTAFQHLVTSLFLQKVLILQKDLRPWTESKLQFLLKYSDDLVIGEGPIALYNTRQTNLGIQVMIGESLLKEGKGPIDCVRPASLKGLPAFLGNRTMGRLLL